MAVRLKAPPPLLTPLRVESEQAESRLFHGEILLAEARCGSLDLQSPAAPSRRGAEQASRSFAGFQAHSFPGCFVCGPARGAGDGLRIFPGAVDDTGLIAAPWTPDESLAGDNGTLLPEFLWAALDCPGAFSVLPQDGRLTIVLGELCASIEGTVRPGEPCVVTAWPLAVEGRKRFAGSAVYGHDGRRVACARAVWIEVPLENWG